jgi:hypothetical protein
MKTKLNFLTGATLLVAAGSVLSQQPTFTRITTGDIVNDQGQLLRTFFSAYFRPNWHRKDFGGLSVLLS